MNGDVRAAAIRAAVATLLATASPTSAGQQISTNFSYRFEAVAFLEAEKAPWFQKISWETTPTADEVAKYFPAIGGVSYVNLACRRIDERGVGDCTVQESEPKDAKLGKAALRIAKGFRYPRPVPSDVQYVTLSFQFTNGPWPLRCLPPICMPGTVPPAPTPPPPPLPEDTPCP